MANTFHEQQLQQIKQDKNKYFVGIVLTVALLIIIGIIAYSEPSHRQLSVDNQIEYGNLQYNINRHEKYTLINNHHTTELSRSNVHFVKNNNNDTIIKINHVKYKCTAHKGSFLVTSALKKYYSHNKLFSLMNMRTSQQYLLRINS